MSIAGTDTVTTVSGQELRGFVADFLKDVPLWQTLSGVPDGKGPLIRPDQKGLADQLRAYKPDRERYPDDDLAYAAVVLSMDAQMKGNYGVGAVIYDKRLGRIVAEGQNERFKPQLDSTAHAEMKAIDDLEDKIKKGDWKGDKKDLVLIASLCPCQMCSSRIIEAGIGSARYVAPDPEGGQLHRTDDLPEGYRDLIRARGQKFDIAKAAPELRELAEEIFNHNVGALNPVLKPAAFGRTETAAIPDPTVREDRKRGTHFPVEGPGDGANVPIAAEAKPRRAKGADPDVDALRDRLDAIRKDPEFGSRRHDALAAAALEEAIDAVGGGNPGVGAVIARKDGSIVLRQGDVQVTNGSTKGQATLTAIQRAQREIPGWTDDMAAQHVLVSTWEPRPLSGAPLLSSSGIRETYSLVQDPYAGAFSHGQMERMPPQYQKKLQRFQQDGKGAFGNGLADAHPDLLALAKATHELGEKRLEPSQSESLARLARLADRQGVARQASA